jgi:hypothetical protein
MRKSGAAAFVVAIAMAFASTAANGELAEKGGLFVSFRGGISPRALPRTTAAPITVRAGGTVRTLSGERPPALRQIEIELNRNGHLDSKGLPTCRYGQLVAASPTKARQACGDALVGNGDYLAKTAFPEQATFPTKGHILAFNAIYRGHNAILAHIYGTDPVPATRVVVFHIRRVRGAFGTVITGHLPPAVYSYGYVRKIDLRLHRNFVENGERRSYLSAACSAPTGFPSATFPFARTSMTFADGRTLSSTLIRSCQVSD